MFSGKLEADQAAGENTTRKAQQQPKTRKDDIIGAQEKDTDRAKDAETSAVKALWKRWHDGDTKRKTKPSEKINDWKLTDLISFHEN